MSNLTVENLEEIQHLSKQIEDAMQSVNALNTKYDQIVKTLKDLDKAKVEQIVENASLKAEILKSSNEVKFLKKFLNDLEQYTRRDCLEIPGIPLPSTLTDLDQTDEVRKPILSKEEFEVYFYSSVANKIYVNESLTEKNKEIFKLCLKFKRDFSYKFLWTNAGRIFLRKNLSSPVILVSCTEDVPNR
ncbi:uncharacterized protein [Montipora foliosa]|uniref:uncharacterized protein n=1 Tax=Montipora foliosa TaxID=591990 RepID=UPI0035F1DE48